MPVNVLGFQTHRDHFAIDFEREKLYERINEMGDDSISDEEYKKKYDLKENKDWQINNARQLIKLDNEWENKIVTCLYRPFDWRFSYFSTVAMDYPRRELINHVAGKNNLCLGLGRQGIAVNDPIWFLIQVSEEPIDANVFRRGGINVFPLYIYPDTDKPEELQQEKRANFSPEFLNKIEKKLGYLPTPEAIFYYIYAVFHSPTYRSRYAEFLKIDFPRVPLTSNNDLFTKLSEVGEKLVQLHLMTSPTLTPNPSPTRQGEIEFVENGGNREAKIGTAKTAWSNGVVKLNSKDYFTGISEEVWNFYIGGYQVCHKWLKDRKGRILSDDDILHYQKIVIALSETIKLMTLIDETIPSFPIE